MNFNVVNHERTLALIRSEHCYGVVIETKKLRCKRILSLVLQHAAELQATCADPHPTTLS